VATCLGQAESYNANFMLIVPVKEFRKSVSNLMQLWRKLYGFCITLCVKESRKKQREVEEKRLAAERAAEEARRKAEEVSSVTICCIGMLFVHLQLAAPVISSVADQERMRAQGRAQEFSTGDKSGAREMEVLQFR